MFDKILVANRGEIACRVIRTLRKMKIASVAVYSEADVHAMHVALADEAICLGPAPANQSYLVIDEVIAAAESTGAQAIHPGYGFLSENSEFAQRCKAAGITFIGPTAEQMEAFGLKHTARSLAAKNNVPLLPGSELLTDIDEAVQVAAKIGYPVMLKSTAGGGGIGMQLCWTEQALLDAYDTVKRLSENNFSQGGIFLEKYVEHARHIEVQVFGDGLGKVVALGERDCSVQRRNQKVIEETPACHVDAALREKLFTAAIELTAAVKYASAGTVEFILDSQTQEFYFLEVNTRLQVEHGVTEEVTGVDLVEWMILQAAGETSFLQDYKHAPQGHAMQLRIYAENPEKNFQPCSGLLSQVAFPEDARCDHWIESGTVVSAYYDPLLAKLIVYGPTREAVLEKMQTAVEATNLAGIETNLDYLQQIIAAETFCSGLATTRYLDTFDYHPRTIDVLESGTMTTVQDFPGRIGYWNVGVPPSGPMDDLSFRLGNELLGNAADAAGLEMTFSGPHLKFNQNTCVCLTGATMDARLNGDAIDFWKPIQITAGDELVIGAIGTVGQRAYLLFQGGLDVPEYLGSRATFTLGQFGGHGGRALKVGDVLKLFPGAEASCQSDALPKAEVPSIQNHWNISVLYGPHGAPDFFTEADIEMFFSTDWEVHYNSARTGVRLIGPKPEWARKDGGEAGLHPSNIHDNAYAIGAIDFTGDMPVILGPDGPSLGGFVCPATIVSEELWKMGQLRPGDTIRFKRVAQASCLWQEAGSATKHAETPSSTVTGVGHRQDACATLGSKFFNPDQEIEINERNLPHWFQPNVSYFVTFRLADSIPEEKLAPLREKRLEWLSNHEEPWSGQETADYHQLFSEQINDWLDAGMGECLLADEQNAKIVADALRHFEGERYNLGEWVVMPNHIHVVVFPIGGNTLSQILHSWKSFTAKAINKAMQREGSVWQDEYYDHIVRNASELYHIDRYIQNNPQKAGIKVAQASCLWQEAGSTTKPAEISSSTGTGVDHRQDACATLGPILHTIEASDSQIPVAYRQAGDAYLLIEYGPLVLDLNLRFRVHALMEWLQAQQLEGIIDLTPGIRSLQVHFDNKKLAREQLLQLLIEAETLLPDVADMVVPTRIVHLPLSWDDAATQLAVEKYMQSVRQDAPWCPDNIEFIRRINGLDTVEAVKDIVFNASYLVMGLGDVYLGAPVATPLDPRRRLVTTKYNPARTWTPENAVGIGGAYLCVYGMEGPGGYQFVGRTVQMWNRYKQTADFKEGKPWLLRFFDQIRFYEVSSEELLQIREDFVQGKFKLKIEEEQFDLSQYQQFLKENDASIKAFKETQQAAFEAERERWVAAGQDIVEDVLETPEEAKQEDELPEGCRRVASHVPGNVWKIHVSAGDRIERGEPLVIVESMKMEIAISAACSGVIESVLCAEGKPLQAGDNLIVIREDI